MSPKLEEIDLDQLDLTNIRGLYDEREEDLLGDSLLKGQQQPILVGPLLGTRRKVFDGSRRVRAARKKGIKKLLAMILDREPTPEELAQFQLISDIHKKHLTPFERSMAAIGIEAANPGLTIKQLAALIDMEESHLWKYLQAKKLSPESMAAYKSGSIGLVDMVKIAKLAHDDQPAMLDIKNSGGSQEMNTAFRNLHSQSAPSGTVKAKSVTIVLCDGTFVTFKKKDITLDSAIKAIAEAAKELEKAKKDGHDALTIASLMKNRKKAIIPTKPVVSKPVAEEAQ